MENGGPAEEAKMFHPIPDDYDGDGLSSVSSFAASSSFSSSVGGFSDHVDCRDRPWQSEVEEIPSFRWLTSPSPVPKPPQSEVDKVAKQAGDVHSSYRAEYADLKAKTERFSSGNGELSGYSSRSGQSPRSHHEQLDSKPFQYVKTP